MRQPVEWEKIFANYLLYKELVVTIKKDIELYSKTTNYWIKNGQMT